MHILIADDDHVAVQTLAALLTAGGHDVTVARDAMQAIRSAITTPPDAVLLDIGMPGGGGEMVLRRLKASSKTDMVPVIVVTGLKDPALPGRARGLGARDVLAKPVDAQQLKQALDRVLGGTSPSPEATP
jgi:DNA-binding response OmpR family regulator